jgi:carboxyl-terminal processing protease
MAKAGKLSALSSLVEKQKIEEEKSKDKDKKEAPKSFEQLEKETRESTLKSLNDNFNFIKDLDREDWFSVYINAISSRFDPHILFCS